MANGDPSTWGYGDGGWSVVTRGLVADEAVAEPAESLDEAPPLPTAAHWARVPAFPFRFETDGELDLSDDERAVLENIEVTLMTTQGEWYKSPNAGSRLPAVLFEPADDATRHLLDFHVREALAAAEPRARFQRTNVEFAENTVRLLVPYVINATSQVRSAEVGLPLAGG